MKLIDLAGRIYNLKRTINYRFVPVFLLRCYMNKKLVDSLWDFLHEDKLRERILDVNPQFFGQLTRSFFFRGSSCQQRYDAIVDTMTAMEANFSEKAREKMYLDERHPLVLLDIPYSNGQEEKKLEIGMLFRAGEVREGAMTLFIALEERVVYHVNFWLWNHEGKLDMYIGCHQGSKLGLELNKELTKVFFGYRPKNLIMYLARELAKYLEVNKLYAVSNYGFYAQNHWGRRNRKLKVSYDSFWQECGGSLSSDKRFFELPIQEARKTMEELPPKKRAKYRKRYIWLDQLAEDFSKALCLWEK